MVVEWDGGLVVVWRGLDVERVVWEELVELFPVVSSFRDLALALAWK